MKTKRKEKEIKEKKRSEEEKVFPGLDLETFNAQAQSFTTRPRGTNRNLPKY